MFWLARKNVEKHFWNAFFPINDAKELSAFSDTQFNANIYNGPLWIRLTLPLLSSLFLSLSLSLSLPSFSLPLSFFSLSLYFFSFFLFSACIDSRVAVIDLFLFSKCFFAVVEAPDEASVK